MKALLNIDYTYDFVATDGALTTGEAGQVIEADLIRVTQEFLETGDFVVFPIDAHDPTDTYHPENKLFPPHNVIGTKGRNLYGKLASLYEEYQGASNVYWIDKRHYSAFSGTDLDIRLRERGITELHLVGVCTDICILHTAIDAYNLGYDIVVHEAAVASFNPTGHAWALEHFENSLGAKVI
ncbi:cysteine hydrolase family protein [Vagococcus humatus]|uniref:Isochorismatase n=1 Tax=Vagococcus humatus TaxID=1889241 RepID=A0A3R9ZW32_9ENTE|nr:isochorismatase family cysteine hydrolase [Vagococcus humatus]RST89116.1 isochorismatase [Vagococcus humatus]